MSKIEIRELFEGLQGQMLSHLNTNREFIEHSGTKGDTLENVWIEWLRSYLPNRYKVDKAIVIDHQGSLSHQLDVVIYDQQYTPFVFNQNGILYIPAEGVYAVFEVKPELKGKVGDDSYIEYAGKKVESVRRLKRTSSRLVDRGISRDPRSLTQILGGILTITGYSKVDTTEKHLKSLAGLQTIDIGCCVNDYSFYCRYKGSEDDKNTDLQARIEDYYKTRTVQKIMFEKGGNSLITFFLQLSHSLQNLGTVAAIDFTEYAKSASIKIQG